MEQIEHFFVSYNEIRDKKFKPLGRFGLERAGVAPASAAL